MFHIFNKEINIFFNYKFYLSLKIWLTHMSLFSHRKGGFIFPTTGKQKVLESE